VLRLVSEHVRLLLLSFLGTYSTIGYFLLSTLIGKNIKFPTHYFPTVRYDRMNRILLTNRGTVMEIDLLEQLNLWHRNGEFEKIAAAG